MRVAVWHLLQGLPKLLCLGRCSLGGLVVTAFDRTVNGSGIFLDFHFNARFYGGNVFLYGLHYWRAVAFRTQSRRDLVTGLGLDRDSRPWGPHNSQGCVDGDTRLECCVLVSHYVIIDQRQMCISGTSGTLRPATGLL